MTDVLSYCFYLALYVMILAIPLKVYLRHQKQRKDRADAAIENGAVYSEGPKAQHPYIDVERCIGCQTCTTVCPEGDVLAMVAGKSAIVNGYKCVGHGLCGEACPVGALRMVRAAPGMGAEMPHVTDEYETNISNLFIVGELGGLGLIKNAVDQGRQAIDIIGKRLAARGTRRGPSGVYDVLIAGAGPAGISASLRAIENQLDYLTLEQDEVGGTVAKFPRQKLVLTSPVEFPMYGRFRKTELSKESLLAFWNQVLNRSDFKALTGERVEKIVRRPDGVFEVGTAKQQYLAHAVVLALGRTGTPRKLGVPGEHLAKVMYRLIEADHYVNKKILVVGGGDSAIEAAMGLGSQRGNMVTLSYRKGAFSRIKERNARRLEECVRRGKVKVIFNSNPLEFRPDSVVLDINGTGVEMDNDFVWIFAGGTPPYDFLKRVGVEFGRRDLTAEASREAKQSAQTADQPVPAS